MTTPELTRELLRVCADRQLDAMGGLLMAGATVLLPGGETLAGAEAAEDWLHGEGGALLAGHSITAVEETAQGEDSAAICFTLSGGQTRYRLLTVTRMEAQGRRIALAELSALTPSVQQAEEEQQAVLRGMMATMNVSMAVYRVEDRGCG